MLRKLPKFLMSQKPPERLVFSNQLEKCFRKSLLGKIEPKIKSQDLQDTLRQVFLFKHFIIPTKRED